MNRIATNSKDIHTHQRQVRLQAHNGDEVWEWQVLWIHTHGKIKMIKKNAKQANNVRCPYDTAWYHDPVSVQWKGLSSDMISLQGEPSIQIGVLVHNAFMRSTPWSDFHACSARAKHSESSIGTALLCSFNHMPCLLLVFPAYIGGRTVCTGNDGSCMTIKLKLLLETFGTNKAKNWLSNTN